jgi:hypothetical protein
MIVTPDSPLANIPKIQVVSTPVSKLAKWPALKPS